MACTTDFDASTAATTAASASAAAATVNEYHSGYSDYAQIASPVAPAASRVRFYAKSDGKFYRKTPDGTEVEIGGIQTQIANGGGTASVDSVGRIVLAPAAGLATHATGRLGINMAALVQPDAALHIVSAATNVRGVIIHGLSGQVNNLLEIFADLTIGSPTFYVAPNLTLNVPALNINGVAAMTQTAGDARYGQLAAANTWTGGNIAQITDAVTAAQSIVRTFRHRSSGTPTAGFGIRHLFQLESDTTEDRDAAAISAVWSTVADATRVSYLGISATRAGVLQERAQFGGASANGLYLPWLSGDANTTLHVGSINASNNQIAVRGQSYSQSGVRGESTTSNGLYGSSSSGPGVNAISTTGAAVSATTTSGAGFSLATTSGIVIDSTVTGAGAAAITDYLRWRQRTAGTAADGFGLRHVFMLSSSTANDQLAAYDETSWATAAHATRKARRSFKMFDYGAVARECLRLEADGTAAMIGFLGAAAVARPAVSGPRNGSAAMTSAMTALASLGLITNSTTAPTMDIPGSFEGKPTASQVVFRMVAGRAFDLPASMTGSNFKADVAATTSTVFSIRKNGVEGATMTMAAAGTTGTFTNAAADSFAAGDVLTVVAPATPDATLADMGWVLVGTLT